MPKLTDTKPKGLLRVALRAPIWLYHAGLGWILDQRFLLLSYVGRKSGLHRETVIEIIGHDQQRDAYYAASGWGTKSDWFQSIRTHPEVDIRVGRRKIHARAQVVNLEEAVQRLLSYARQHPTAFHELSGLITGRTLEGTEEDCRQMAQSVPVIAFYASAAGLNHQ